MIKSGMAKWNIGCSGFHYKHWKGGFYPDAIPQKKWFEFYNEHFKTVELNVTFYRFPRLPFLQEWYNNSSPDFLFSVKAPRAITHFKQFRNCAQMLSDFYGTVLEGLREKTGCILFQLPPRMAYKETKLQQIIDSLDPAFKNVLEFRHESWWTVDVYKILSQHHITFCGQSHPDLPDEVIQNNEVVYYRFHGIPDLYRSPYHFKTLKKVADAIEENEKTKEAFIYFNNDIEVSAIRNALDMDAYLKKQKEKPRK